jgi:protein-tyrosine phosphatase
VFEHILILCVANRCRSPMAEVMLRAALAQQGRHPRVRSAGVAALDGDPADEMTLVHMAARGFDLSRHRSAALRQAMVRDADLILVMEEAQRHWLLAQEPAAAGKVHLLGHWTGTEIADPVAQPKAVYDDAIRLIEGAVAQWAHRL